MYYTEHKLKNAKRGRAGNEARNYTINHPGGVATTDVLAVLIEQTMWVAFTLLKWFHIFLLELLALDRYAGRAYVIVIAR